MTPEFVLVVMLGAAVIAAAVACRIAPWKRKQGRKPWPTYTQADIAAAFEQGRLVERAALVKQLSFKTVKC